MSTSYGSQYLPGIAALCASFVIPGTSGAHFVLQSPPAATEQGPLGDPQKAPPCGDDGTAVATDVVTPYQAGETITVTINETIPHPGHYRIALALDDLDELPPEPPVTPGDTPCGSAPIDPAPVFPVLADGVFEHTDEFSEPQSIEIKLPDDVTCTHCTLQIIQFMSDHGLNDPGGCYYHHCATISVQAGPVDPTSTSSDESGASSDDGATTASTVTTADGSTDIGETSEGAGEDSSAGDADAGTGAVSDTEPRQAPETTDGGCGCSLPRGGTNHHLGMLLGLLGIVGLRARRRGSRARCAGTTG